MKKYLLLTLLTLFAPSVYAAHISHNDYTSGNTITASGQNTNENAIVNEINGNLDSTNLAAGAVTSTNLGSDVTAKFVPTGSVFYWVGSTNSVPTGYLYCNGQAVSRTTYALLFNAVGVTFGQGDNSTTFNLPDMRGYFVRGVNDASGNDPDAASRTAPNTGGATGDNVGSVQVSTFAVHNHAITDPGHQHTRSQSSPSISVDNTGSTRVDVFGSNAGAASTTSSNTTGITVNNAGGNETRPRNINMAGIIKY